MSSFIATSVKAPVADARFASKAELDNLSQHFQEAQARLEAAELLSKHIDRFSAEMANHVSQKMPEVNATSSFLFTSVPDIQSSSLQEDISVLIRLLTYCLVAGSSNPSDAPLLDDIFNEISTAARQSCDVSVLWYVESLRFLKTHHGLCGASAAEANSYIDSMIDVFS